MRSILSSGTQNNEDRYNYTKHRYIHTESRHPLAQAFIMLLYTKSEVLKCLSVCRTIFICLYFPKIYTQQYFTSILIQEENGNGVSPFLFVYIVFIINSFLNTSHTEAMPTQNHLLYIFST